MDSVGSAKRHIFHVEQFDDGIIITIMDCTGHGVPGALMTMMVCSGLRRVIRTEKCHNPATILRRLNHIVKTSLHQDTEYSLSDDGVDAAICFISFSENGACSKLVFAGASLPLYYIKNGKMGTVKGDRHSIGYKRSDLDHAFANHSMDIEPGMSFYLATDGFTDQLGGERVRSFGKKRFTDVLLKTSRESFQTQQQELFSEFNNFRGDYERIDDMTVIGFGFADSEDSGNRRWCLPDDRSDLVDRRKGPRKAETNLEERRRFG